MGKEGRREGEKEVVEKERERGSLKGKGMQERKWREGEIYRGRGRERERQREEGERERDGERAI